CQDLTALMFQALGIEGPIMPPTMPKSLREHLYPSQRQQQQLQQQRQQLQKQRYLAYLTSQQQRQTKDNPYTLLRQMQQMKAAREHPRKINDAKAAGCAQPGEAAPILMFSDCRNAASRMICQAEMMTCMNVGMGSMCCPYGINGLALDAIGYVNKMQQYVEAFA
ncbi:unnamed protein product, partial [Candidula unifasciata]